MWRPCLWSWFCPAPQWNQGSLEAAQTDTVHAALTHTELYCSADTWLSDKHLFPRRGLPQNRMQDPFVPRRVSPGQELMREVSVERSFPKDPVPATREIRKTISLPEECSKSRPHGSSTEHLHLHMVNGVHLLYIALICTLPGHPNFLLFSKF